MLPSSSWVAWWSEQDIFPTSTNRNDVIPWKIRNVQRNCWETNPLRSGQNRWKSLNASVQSSITLWFHGKRTTFGYVARSVYSTVRVLYTPIDACSSGLNSRELYFNNWNVQRVVRKGRPLPNHLCLLHGPPKHSSPLSFEREQTILREH